jgi:hypothetical protein
MGWRWFENLVCLVENEDTDIYYKEKSYGS